MIGSAISAACVSSPRPPLIGSPPPNDRDCAGCCADRPCDGIRNCDDHVRVAADHLASEIGIALGPALGGIPLHGEVLSLDITQPAQLLENRLVETKSPLVDAIDGNCGFDDRNPVLLRSLLRPHRLPRAREQQTGREIASSHIITSSAAVGTPGTIAPRALAFRLSQANAQQKRPLSLPTRECEIRAADNIGVVGRGCLRKGQN
jgi:hypothetical protein